MSAVQKHTVQTDTVQINTVQLDIVLVLCSSTLSSDRCASSYNAISSMLCYCAAS